MSECAPNQEAAPYTPPLDELRDVLYETIQRIVAIRRWEEDRKFCFGDHTPPFVPIINTLGPTIGVFNELFAATAKVHRISVGLQLPYSGRILNAQFQGLKRVNNQGLVVGLFQSAVNNGHEITLDPPTIAGLLFTIDKDETIFNPRLISGRVETGRIPEIWETIATQSLAVQLSFRTDQESAFPHPAP